MWRMPRVTSAVDEIGPSIDYYDMRARRRWSNASNAAILVLTATVLTIGCHVGFEPTTTVPSGATAAEVEVRIQCSPSPDASLPCVRCDGGDQPDLTCTQPHEG